MNKKNIGSRTKPKGKHFPIVAIGASAGGLEAITELLKHLPGHTGMAFVYIQHLDPSHKSMLSAILSKSTPMKVSEAKHLSPIEPDHLYIMPSDRDISLIDGVLTLNPRRDTPSMHKPVDKFFTDLADRQKNGAIGIILSGAANDGTVGLRAIKNAGGLTFAQDETAKFQSMPKSAIAEGVVDMVLNPQGIAAELERLSKQTDAIKVAMQDEDTMPDDKNEDLLSIIQLLKKSTGVDFTHYKMNTIKRRIIRRMLLHKLDTLGNYVQYLRQHASEISVLYQDLLINVTSFFRDPDATEYLKKTLFPRMLKNKAANDPLRIWVPACSTGEEAYSIAIIITEVLGDRTTNTSIQIFATDLSETAIAKARVGLYSPNEVVEVSPRRLQRFFNKVDGGYRVVKSIRDMCVFAPHNVFRDPPFSRLDFISCCNVLIYLDTVLQKKVLATFHYALNPDGFLMLGRSETTGGSSQLFSQVEKKYKIYARKKDATGKAMFDMNYRFPEMERPDRKNAGNKISHKDIAQPLELDKEVDNILLTRFVPACVVVNQDLDILQFRGSTGLYLEPSPGKASLSLLKMAKPGLAFELRNAIHKADKTGNTVKKSGLEVKHGGQVLHISIEVVPLTPELEERMFIVIFEQESKPSATELKSSFSKDKLVKQLQDELNTMKEDMRSIIEEQEAGYEELQSANEEIVSSNEELQSINEELETSKEEIESTNEELMTINTELQVRNEQLGEAYDYAEALVATIREAMLVLDQDLRVKSANRAFYKIFQVKEEETEGVLVYELGDHQWNIPQLRSLLEEIIPANAQFHGFEVVHTFPHIGKKVMLLNARRVVQKIHRQQLILLAIEDVTDFKKVQAELDGRETWYHSVVNTIPQMVWAAGKDKLISFVNDAWLSFTGRTAEQEKGYGWTENIHKDDLESVLKVYHSNFNERTPFRATFRLKRQDGVYRQVELNGKPILAHENELTGFGGSCSEIPDAD